MKNSLLKRRKPLLARVPMKAYTRLASSKPMKTYKALRRRAHSTAPPTALDLARFSLMREHGCIACMMNRKRGIATATFNRRDLEIHHLLSGGVRIGHHAVVCLCHYHHQGKRLPFLEQGYKAQAAIFGPSLEREPRVFRAMYGDDDALLAYQVAVLKEQLHA
ncbi:Ref family recombination enhancement nuclease [Dyella sp. 2RAB6]|uniref:Ref family recombination enhancement nuclease n=1 Tax=Dyella sp. 2RAB6 TaxID=3232992 RepID=UPI003F939409